MYQKILNSTDVRETATGRVIPFDAKNFDYQQVQAWLDAGNVLPDAQSPKIPKVTMRQARLALLGAGKLPAVNAAIAAMQGAQGEAARIEWEYSQEVQRDRGLVSALGSQLGMTEEQLDALFTAAAAIP